MYANKMDKLLAKLYYDPKKGFIGINALLRKARFYNSKIQKSDILDWISRQSTYSVHKPARRSYKRNKVIVSSIDEQWQADLVDLQSLEKYNDGYRYILTSIDLFSKFSWAILLKSKTSENIKNAFSHIFRTNRKPYKLQISNLSIKKYRNS